MNVSATSLSRNLTKISSKEKTDPCNFGAKDSGNINDSQISAVTDEDVQMISMNESNHEDDEHKIVLEKTIKFFKDALDSCKNANANHQMCKQ